MGKANVVSAPNNHPASEWKEGNVLNSLPRLKKSRTVAEDRLVVTDQKDAL